MPYLLKALVAALAIAAPAAAQDRLPEFKGITAWLNSAPLAAESLRSKVVLVDFITYGCSNCRNTFPHVQRWHEKYKDQGLVIVGVHTPEFGWEKDKANVQKALAKHGLTFPVAMDNDYETWNAFGNRYWPAQYLADARGNIRLTHFGEGDYDRIEKAIQSLLMEAKRTQK